MTIIRTIRFIAALVFVAFILNESADAETANQRVSPTSSPAPSADKVFERYDTDGDGYLDVPELMRYVIDTHPIFSKPAFKKYYATDSDYAKAVDLEAKPEATAIARQGVMRNGEWVVDLPAFKEYLKSKAKEKEKDKAKKEKIDVLKKLTGFLTDGDLHISKSITVKQSDNGGSAEPARFAWTKPSSGKGIFTIDAALSYSYAFNPMVVDGIGNAEFILQPAVEAHTSTDPKAQQDSISAKIPLQLVVSPPTRNFIGSHYFAISPVYETDHAKSTETYGGEIFYSPTIPDLYIGSTTAFPGMPDWIRFGWRPFVGFEGAEVSQPPPKTGYKLPPEFVRFAAKIHTDLSFTNRFTLAMDYCHRNFFYGDDAAFDYVEVSPIYYFDPDQHLSLGMTYKNGYTSPQFSWVHSLSLWVGIKF